MTTLEESAHTFAARKLYGEGFAMMAANRWNGTDLHADDGQTLRFTREDPEGDYWIGTLSRNGIVGKDVTVSANISADSLAVIAWELWQDR
jgi:hypothetical protein